MVGSVLAISEVKLQELKDKAPVLSAHDRNVLRDLVKLLTLFEEATDFVQADLSPSSGTYLRLGSPSPQNSNLHL